MQTWTFWDQLAVDVLHALRGPRKHPGYAIAAILTLALGLGANAAVFTLVDAALLRPLPYTDSSRLVHADWRFADGNVPSLTGTEFSYWSSHSHVFTGTAAVNLYPTGMDLAAGGEPTHIQVLSVSCDFFTTLGVQPVLGRAFTANEDRPGGPEAVVLSHELWQQQFGADPHVVGRAVMLGAESYVVVGVMPQGFAFVLPWAAPQTLSAFTPLRLVPDVRDNGHDYTMVGRLKPGISLAAAQADMARVLREIRQDLPGAVRKNEGGIELIPYQSWVTGDISAPLLILMSAAGLVFLIAAVNFANLALARAIARRPETALRFALGASRPRVLRQTVTETLVLAALGGAAALAAVPWTLHGLEMLAPPDLPIVGAPALDWRVLAFTLALAAVVGVFAGIAPMRNIFRMNLTPTIRQGAQSVVGAGVQQRMRHLMVTGEIALSVLLLASTLLPIGSLTALERLNPGFRPQGVTTFHLSVPKQRFASTPLLWNFEQAMLDRLERLPGVETAATTSALPLQPGMNGGTRITQGRRQTDVYVELRAISPDYFATMRIPLLRGRAFLASDSAAAPPVAVVDAAYAQACCKGGSVIGSLVSFGGEEEREIVGVAGSTREDELAAPEPPTMYVPTPQLVRMPWLSFFGDVSFAVRSRVPLDYRQVRAAAAAVDPNQAVAQFQPMQAVLDQAMGPNEFMAALMTGFAALALTLAAIGLYGVMAYAVAARTHEIGLRMALGANTRQVGWLVARDVGRTTLIGIGAGLLFALGLTRLLAAVLFGVSPHKAWAMGGAALLMAAVAALASYLPLRRATHVAPNVALRYD